MYVVSVYAETPALRDILARAREHPERWLHELVQATFRPSLTEVIYVTRNCPECHAMLRRATGSTVFTSPSSRNYKAAIVDGGPRLIAFLEAVFPNGLYATLGRDSLTISDIIEAFYLARGNHHAPLVRLGASSPTVVALSAADRLLEFLVSNGIDVERAARGEVPIALIDRTSYTLTSQTTKFVSSILRSTVSASRKAALARNVNVVNTASGYQLEFTADGLDKLAAVRAMWDERFEVRIPTLLRAPDGIASLTDVEAIAWHDSYQKEITANQYGALSGMPGAPKTFADRMGTLAYFHELYQIVGGPEFLQRTQLAGRQLGLELSEERFRTHERVPQKSAHERIHEFVRADFATLVPNHDLSPVERALIAEIVELRQRRWTELLTDRRPDEKTREFRQMNLWRKQLEAFRVTARNTTNFGRLFAELSYDQPTLAVSEYEAPQTKNGETLFRLIRHWQNSGKLAAEDVLAVLRQVEINARLRVLSRGDQSQLIDVALDNLGHADDQRLEDLRQVIEHAPLLRRRLIEGAQRLKHLEAYRQLVDAQVLPAPRACARELAYSVHAYEGERTG